MGRPKALLPLADAPLVARVVAALRAVTDDVVVVAAPGQELPPLPARLVSDRVPHEGPLNGIRHGLAAAQSDVCVVAPCDAAFLQPALVSHLLAAAAGYDVVVPRWLQRLQPLHAVYRRSVLPLVEEELARGGRRPVSVFDQVRTRTIDEDEVRSVDPEGWSFFNINTPEEYRRAVARLGRIPCTVELFGIARLVARTREVPLTVAPGSTTADVLAALADRHPCLRGPVIDPEGRGLTDGYACNVNGLDFVRRSPAPVAAGDSILILSADAGG